MVQTPQTESDILMTLPACKSTYQLWAGDGSAGVSSTSHMLASCAYA